MPLAGRYGAGSLWLLERISRRRYMTEWMLSQTMYPGRKAKGIVPESLVARRHNSSRSDSEKLDRLKSFTNPGLGRQDFLALFRSPSDHRIKHKVYPLRWDWHLRMFLYSMIPPTALYIFTVLVDYLMLNDDEIVKILDLEEIRRVNKAENLHWFYGLWGWWNFESKTKKDKTENQGQEETEIDNKKSTEESAGSSIIQRLERRLSIMEDQFKELYEELEMREKAWKMMNEQGKGEKGQQTDEESSRKSLPNTNSNSADEIVAAARQVSRSIARPMP